MERKKLKLEELRVQSFITELKSDVAHTAKGGDDDTTTGSLFSVEPAICSVVVSMIGTNWPVCPAPTLGPGGPTPTLTPPFSSNLTVNF